MDRILIVDDAAFMRLALRTVLEKNGYEVVGEGRDGASAVQLYKELSPDLVTMDITMPGMTGIEALKSIKEFDPNAKIIMISAMGQEPMVKESVLYGANSFIVKPFKEEHVINTFKKVLNL